MTPLRARGLHRFYRRGGNEVAALLDVSLSCAPGEIVAVTGPSGSGKSTLLGLLAGLDDPDGGAVHVAGLRLSHTTPAAAARLRARHIGILTQSSALLGHLSVLENVRFAASLRGASAASLRGASAASLRGASAGSPRAAGGRGARTRATGAGPSPDELVDGLGLRAVRHATPRTLSGGETARAGLAVALAGAPTVLLADEPTAEVSRDEEGTVLDLLRTWRPRDGATVIVTHSDAVAEQADRVVHLIDGRIV